MVQRSIVSDASFSGRSAQSEEDGEGDWQVLVEGSSSEKYRSSSNKEESGGSSLKVGTGVSANCGQRLTVLGPHSAVEERDLRRVAKGVDLLTCRRLEGHLPRLARVIGVRTQSRGFRGWIPYPSAVTPEKIFSV